MPLVRSNSGNSCSYAPLNPPDIRPFNCADAATGQNSSVAKMTNEKAFMIGSSPARSRASDETISHFARQEVTSTADFDLAYFPDELAASESRPQHFSERNSLEP